MSIDALGLSGALLALVSAAALSNVRPAAAPWLAAGGALVAAVCLAVAWVLGAGGGVDLPWIPSLGSRFQVSLDPLGAPLAVFAAGLAALVLAYTAGYLPRHLAEHGRDLREQGRFCALMLAFTGAMLLLLLAQDLLLLFAALELTAVASFLLIGFDDDRTSRRSAMLALVMTLGSSLLFLVGALWIGAVAGSTGLAELRPWAVDGVGDGDVPAGAAVLLALGVLAKSAQVPLHFWLPRAMVAPTPVSAYLHSAALVAAGVFALARVRFLLAPSPALLDGLLAVGFLSIFVGAALALISDELKRVLAYSTIAQYGYILVLVALGGEHGAAGAPFSILAHGLCKCALFLTAGAITISLGIDRLSQAGGLLRRAPVLAVASAVAAAGLAGLPGTVGFFKDELLFAAALKRGHWVAALAAAGVAATVAYTARFWADLFLGRRSVPERGADSPEPTAPAPGWRLTWPVVALAAAVLLFGLWPEPLAPAFAEAGARVRGQPTSLHLAYRAGPEAAVAGAAWAAGLLVFSLRARVEPALGRSSGLAGRVGPARWGALLARGAERASDVLHRIEVRDLRDRISAVLVPGAVLVFAALLAQGRFWAPTGELGWSDLPLAAALFVIAGAAVAAARIPEHVGMLLALSFVGFGLGLVFALSGAPDVALVVVLVETTLTILFMALLSRMRPESLRSAREHCPRTARGPWVAVLAGATLFVVAWFDLAAPWEGTVAWAHMDLADEAHAKDVVTAILADFRGLDTAVELTVLAVAVLGAAAISWGRTQ